MLVNILLLAQGVAAVDLELIDGDSCDVRARKPCNVDGGTSDTASAIKDFGALGNGQAASDVVLMTEDGGLEGLSLASVGEVKRLAPSPFEEFRGKVVVLVHELGVRGFAGIKVGCFVVLELVVSVDTGLKTLAASHGGKESCGELKGVEDRFCQAGKDHGEGEVA